MRYSGWTGEAGITFYGRRSNSRFSPFFKELSYEDKDKYKDKDEDKRFFPSGKVLYFMTSLRLCQVMNKILDKIKQIKGLQYFNGSWII